MSFFISVLFSIDTGDQETDEWRVIDSTQSASDFSTDDESSSSSYTNDETSSFSSEDSTDSECRRAIPHKRARLSSEEIADKGEDCQRAWAEWFKEEEEEPSTSKRPRTRGLHSRCPVPGCNARSKHLKHHVWDCHIPQVFWDHPWRELEWSPDYHPSVPHVCKSWQDGCWVLQVLWKLLWSMWIQILPCPRTAPS